MRILIVSDAWHPQINGVVTTLVNTVAGLEHRGHEVHVISPAGFRTVPLPTYPEIRLAVLPSRVLSARMDALDPDAVHIATEAPLGIAARRHCLATGRAFSTAYHTQFPEYLHARTHLPVAITYAWLRRFHAPSCAVMVGTSTIRHRLTQRGFRNLVAWSRGVDTELFVPAPREHRNDGPIFLSVGRLAVEKNLPAFLALDLPGRKWVVGDGPARAALERRFPDARFFGAKRGAELAHFYQQADVFVFPSRTDTFGLVLAEAMACGTPVAAFPVTGPIDVVTPGMTGEMSEDLRAAALAALKLERAGVRRFALRFSWHASTLQFEANLRPRAEFAVCAAD